MKVKKNLRQSYKFFKRYNGFYIDVKEYLKINHLFLKFILKKVFEGHEVMLPLNLGTLSVVGRKQKIYYNKEGQIKGLAPDWVKTKKYWDENPEAKKEKKLLYHTNSHTDSYRYKFLWSKKNSTVENKTLYSLRMSRENKRLISNYIKEGKPYKCI